MSIDPDGKNWYFIAAEIASTKDISDSDYIDEFTDMVYALNDRSIKNGHIYMLLTCINRWGFSTRIGVLCTEPHKALKELEIACSIIETLSHGKIKCNPIDSPLSVFKHCFSGHSPMEFLSNILLRRHNNREHPLILHPLSTSPTYSLYTAKEYHHLASIFGRGSIAIGYLYSNPNIKISLSDEHVLRHIAIVGSTGSGKSTTASILAEKASEKNYSVVVIDWHGEYITLFQNSRDRLVYTNPVKGVVPEPLSLEELIKREPLSFIEILESSLELTPPQAHILEDAVNLLVQKYTGQGYYLDLIIDIIQNSAATARWFAESREALLRKLKPLSSSYLNIKWSDLKKVEIEKGKIYIFDVSYIPNVRVRKIISSLLIKSIVIKAQYNNIARPILLVVDEAHNIFHAENPISMLVAEVRKWGIGFAVITQAPSMISPVVIKNTNTKIIHALKSSSDIKAVIATAILKKEHKKVVSALKPGEALLCVPELAEPVLIKISRN
uniref:DUF87 domain-containing protein n=1 Tax=Ignisphaera aggregans TaxID=334771 RepID=A0A7C2V8R5_9CREN